jgi:hypothetical protein
MKKATVQDFMENVAFSMGSSDNLAVIAAEEFDLFTADYSDVQPWVVALARKVFANTWGQTFE